ncbi:hypothetical protein QL285_033706 [Trifolium repens]|nr:hypothetical protein QL285_033706 [Trifolium repens]
MSYERPFIAEHSQLYAFCAKPAHSAPNLHLLTWKALIGPICTLCAKMAHPAQLPENSAPHQAALRILHNSWRFLCKLQKILVLPSGSAHSAQFLAPPTPIPNFWS